MTTEQADPDHLETIEDVRIKYGLSPSAESLPGPGAMSGEALWVALAYQAMMDGDGDDLGHGYTVLTVDPEDCIAWNLRPDTESVGIHVTDDGFIYGFQMTTQQASELIAEHTAEQSQCPGCGELPVESDCTEHEYHCATCHHGYNSDDVFPN